RVIWPFGSWRCRHGRKYPRLAPELWWSRQCRLSGLSKRILTPWGGTRMKADAFRYDGKRALVVGGATGMGAATAELVQDLGAEVVVMDYAEVKLPGAKAIHVNLAEEASINAAVDECGGPIHALFSCAGVADGTP